MKKEWKLRMQKTAGIIVALAIGLGIAGAARNGLQPQDGRDAPVIKVEGAFYCNVRALSAKERTRHKELTEKLLAARNETIETEKGYEFQYSPDKITIAEVGEWVVVESKCCPFFDFHIDLEKLGSLICLRLTGSEGIKAFIRSEFRI